MIKKRLWIALLAIPICLISVFLVSAQRSRQADAGGVIDPTCTSSLPCIEYDNNGTGPGVRGISLNGNGLGGSTKHNSTSVSNSLAGVQGSDNSTSGNFNSGVRGFSTRGEGVMGQSSSGPGVQGVSSTAAGVLGVSTNGIGVRALSSNFVGEQVSGGGITGVGKTEVDLPALSVNGNGNSPDLIDVCNGNVVNPCSSGASLPSPLFTLGIDGTISITGDIFTAGVFSSGSGVAVEAATNGMSPTVEAFGGTGDIYEGFGGPGRILVFYVDNVGNVHAHSFTADLAAKTGQRLVTYASQASQPTIEDFGEAQLVNGQAFVRLDPKFANVIDQRANYLVFITPEGDANVLYVTQKSLGGFTVRESHAGRSILMFSYRIVAKPLGSHEARLPMVELPKLRSGSPARPRRFHSQP